MGDPIFADGTTEVEAAALNQMVAAGGGKLGVFMWYGRLAYNGAAWEVVSTTDSCKITAGALAWDSVDDQLEITLTDFSAPPLVLATPVAADANYNVKAHATSAAEAVVRFYNIDTGAKITTEDTNMDVGVLIIGIYP